MEVTATAKNIRVSPNKVRLVVDQIKKMQPNDALRILDFVQKSASLPLKKVIASAIANAKNNHNLKEENLTFTEIQVGLGQVFKRYRPISRGRAHSILKRTSNIRIVLEAKEDKTNTSNKSDVSDKKKPKGGYRGAKS